MNNDEDLLETHGLVSTHLFNVKDTKTISASSNLPINTDTEEYLNRNLYARDRINISRNLSQPWPNRHHKNEQPVISNTIEDITEDNYTKYHKSYVSIDFNLTDPQPSDPTVQSNVLVENARYIINLNRTYKDIYKIKLVDFAIYNLSLTYTSQILFSVPEPIKFTPYVLLRVQPMSTKEFASQTNLQVASSLPNTERQIFGYPLVTPANTVLTYPVSEPYSTSLSKIRIYKPLPQNTSETTLTYDDFIEPIFTKNEMFYNDSIKDVTQLLITIYDSNGNVYESMQQHHFTLEIIEKVNILKNTNINTKNGEVDLTGVTKSNPLLF